MLTRRRDLRINGVWSRMPITDSENGMCNHRKYWLGDSEIELRSGREKNMCGRRCENTVLLLSLCPTQKEMPSFHWKPPKTVEVSRYIRVPEAWRISRSDNIANSQ